MPLSKNTIGIDTVISEKLFDEFKNARSIAEKMYLTFIEMMTHAHNTLNRECLILGQTNKMLNNEIEKLLRKVEIQWKNNNAQNAEIINSLKINDYLNDLEESHSNVAEMEPSPISYLNAFDNNFQKT
ncbi:hypothetical protein DVH24_019813 [Malus domestica]|uniref:Uncharacterized protein n=1 Tax=Malus domestica TaxID=3750 RepID=A0A498I4B1_MALDO|nr:hypothetical protein DVH24_019813 [Malus domestica]